MAVTIVVSNPKDWEFDIEGVEVISPKTYINDVSYLKASRLKVFNLCRTYKYQSAGYYVSLLAAARNHRAIPSISTIQDMKSNAIVKIISEELDDLIQKSLEELKADQFTLSIYFGKNISKKYNKLSLQLFNLFQAPLLRAQFVKQHNKWQLQSINPIAAGHIPEDHKSFVESFAESYFSAKRFSVPERNIAAYDMAILVNPKEENSPSCDKTIQKFIKAAEQLGISASTVTKDDYSSLAEYDALFIRETTAVNHHTFRFAQRARAHGMVVVDDPDSIIKCTNKVYLAELLQLHGFKAPKTIIVHKENQKQVVDELGFPIILKQPDSSFSLGVVKVKDYQEYKQQLDRLLEKSELIVAQEFLQTDFDWRVGIFDGEPLFICRYFMAQKHWQIINKDKSGREKYGKVESIPVDLAPKGLIKAATKLAGLIGNSLYGVDVKQKGNEFYIIEINDNPNIDTGMEDDILKDKLYLKIMEIFLRKIKQSKKTKK